MGEGAELGGLVGVVFLGEVECANVVVMCGCVDLQQRAVGPLEWGGSVGEARVVVGGERKVEEVPFYLHLELCGFVGVLWGLCLAEREETTDWEWVAGACVEARCFGPLGWVSVWGGGDRVVWVRPVVGIPGPLLSSSLSRRTFQTTCPPCSVGVGLFESTVVVFGGVGLGSEGVGDTVVQGLGWVGKGPVCWGIGWVSQ